jgi:hypothetical protein
LPQSEEIVLTRGNKLEFILAVPGRRYGDFVDLLEPFHSAQCLPAVDKILGEVRWGKLRLTTEVRHPFGEIPVFPPRPANEFRDLPQFSGSK